MITLAGGIDIQPLIDFADKADPEWREEDEPYDLDNHMDIKRLYDGAKTWGNVILDRGVDDEVAKIVVEEVMKRCGN